MFFLCVLFACLNNLLLLLSPHLRVSIDPVAKQSRRKLSKAEASCAAAESSKTGGPRARHVAAALKESDQPMWAPQKYEEDP